MPVPVRDRCSPDAHLVAALLRTQISRHIIRHPVPVDSKLRMAAVHIGLFRPKAIPFQAVIIRIHREQHAEFRQFTHFHGLIHSHPDRNLPVPKHLIADDAVLLWLRAQVIGIGDNQAAVRLFHRTGSRRVSVAFLYGAVHPRISPLSGSHGEQVGDVIVRHGPPEIRLRRGLYHFPAPVPVGYEAAVEDGEQGFEIPAPCTDIVPAPYDLRLRGRGPDRPGMSRYQLPKSHFMAFWCPGQSLLQTK